MVRKIMITLAMCMAFIGIAGTPALAEETEIYNYPVMTLSEEESTQLYALSTEAYQGTISTTYITFFRDIVAGIPANHDYVFFRSGDNSYTMYSGDLDYSGGEFLMNGDGKEYVITQVSGSGYSSSYYSYSVSDVFDVGVDVGSFLVYSNLGNYPQFDDRGVQYEYALLLAFTVFGVCALVRPLSSFVLRFRNGN